MNYIDFIIIGIIIIYLLIGYFKGFMFSLLSLFSFPVKFIGSVLLCKPFLLFTNNVCKLDTALSNGIMSNLTKTSPLFAQSMDGMTQSEITSHIDQCLDTTKYPSSLKSFFTSIFEIKEENSSFSFGEVLSDTLGSFFSYIISFAVIFTVVSLVVFFLKRKSKKLSENSITVRRVDKVFGIIYGFGRGVLNIVIVIAVLCWFKNFSFLSNFYESLYSSAIGGWASDIIFTFVDKFLNLKEIAKWFLNLL